MEIWEPTPELSMSPFTGPLSSVSLGRPPAKRASGPEGVADPILAERSHLSFEAEGWLLMADSFPGNSMCPLSVFNWMGAPGAWPGWQGEESR